MAGNTQDKRVNDQQLRGLKDGGTLTYSLAGRGNGSILFKKTGSVISAYYRWNLNKKPGQLKIGHYSSTPPGMKLSDIRTEAGKLAKILKDHGNPKEYLASQASAAESKRIAEAKTAEAVSQLGTFKDLLDHYSADLLARGRVKAGQIARMFEMHVIEPFPELVAKPARYITDEDINSILDNVRASKPRNRGRNRSTKAPVTSMASTENTLHTYLRAAFESGISSRFSRNRKRQTVAPKRFGITINVAAAVGKMDDVYEGSTETLNQHEIGALLRHLDHLPERNRALALAPIYLGGQRLKMLMSLEWGHMYEDGILLFDKKGKRGSKPYPHFLPLTPRVLEILQPLLVVRTSDKGPFALSKNLVRSDYAGKFYSEAGAKLHADGLTRDFSWKNVRVACESVLAGMGVTEEIRAHILSHGRKSGVQAKHYDRNLYYKEKFETLTAWGEYLDELRMGKIREEIKLANLHEMRSRGA
ncbi:hypothetical protein P8H27_02125 [Pseudomonas sp. sp1636]|uniref:hypothetical protein n=1 Tax=Pseudomonas sp. sp1636 TaxID=3036707 RepID=UPI0025A51043|nr:hypothetical protein [Pseudomonas sp. sp1636]MDM8347692.1 hypothetical protein [Pseudomonas sp. sp1636]